MNTNNKRYGVILADPPWQYQNYAAAPGEKHDRQRGAQKHYPTMTLDDIAAMPISDMAADQCALFLWATWPLLGDAMELITAWGFEYKTIAWVWAKLNPSSFGFFVGMGYYTRSNTEPCLLAFKGGGVVPNDRSVSSLLVTPVMKHSRKPDEQYNRIERLYDGPYLELFARRQCPGWDVFGNEVENSIDLNLGVNLQRPGAKDER